MPVHPFSWWDYHQTYTSFTGAICKWEKWYRFPGTDFNFADPWGSQNV